MGLKAYRFSVAWTRILPNGVGDVNEKGVAYYRDVIRECKKMVLSQLLRCTILIYPIVWRKKGMVKSGNYTCFVEYAEVLFQNLGKK